MLRFIVLSLLLLGSVLFAEPSVFPDSEPDDTSFFMQMEGGNSTDSVEEITEEESTENLIYLGFEKLPKKLYVGEIFPVTLKVTSLVKDRLYTVTLEDGKDVILIQEPELIEPKAINHLTFYFKATGTSLKLPDFVVSYEDDPERVYRIEGNKIRAVRLNPPRDFCGVLAQKFSLVNYQASTYTKESNILALQLSVAYGNYDDFHLPRSANQGIDSYSGDLNDTTLFYYAVYPTEVEQVEFSYFNLSKNRYEKFQVPIIVKRSSVSTQSNLDPQESEFTKFKIAATAMLIFIWLILWMTRKGWVYPILILLAAAYLLTYLIPLKSVCIRPDTTLYLLPTPQSTPFMQLYEQTTAKEMNKNGGYTKVRLPNNTIGWVKNEDLCTY
ncbi:SH3 domain-containing protein [Hydrogenimonas cancrithermarum]|uniref:Periplasmic protein n=1 Tax=Hydrogenimonas cancrithermarum TaxID=2993563 RepID=A0ABM8FK82_9BACT|nr:hypothetical protein [Hydrogenimonas cancrithermarum]BDY12070.1 hypothetical protein HCR_03820 [Hydrogenimonas cancrithermarum]